MRVDLAYLLTTRYPRETRGPSLLTYPPFVYPPWLTEVEKNRNAVRQDDANFLRENSGRILKQLLNLLT